MNKQNLALNKDWYTIQHNQPANLIENMIFDFFLAIIS